MNDPRTEARRRLEDEERMRRLREGGESQRAQLAIEEAQRASRTGQEGPAYSGLTPQEEERRRLMSGQGAPHAGMGEDQRASMASWSREGREGMTMEDRVARDIREEREPMPGRTPAEQMSERERERGYGRGEMPTTYSRREGPVEERPTLGEQTARAAMGTEGRRDYGTAERMARGDLGRAGGGTYYYEGRESQASGEAAPQSYFGRTDYMPSRKPPIEAEPTPGERMRERGGGMAATAGEAGGQAVTKAKGMGEQALGRTKEYGRRIGERTRGATGGAKAEDVATQAGESIGRGIRKVAAVGAGILSGLRRGVESSSREGREQGYERERRGEMREPEERMTQEREYREASEDMPRGEYRETEYREVRRKEEPKR